MLDKMEVSVEGYFDNTERLFFSYKFLFYCIGYWRYQYTYYIFRAVTNRQWQSEQETVQNDEKYIFLSSICDCQYQLQHQQQQQIMQVVTDPDNYQASQIVQKSSKSGIFSNKRLLVIKNGFLYYFTNVPKNYKTHVPNILNTLKQLPKSSIEIKAINQIKMQSSNSANLIIKFNEKDMIEREDIRKSISDRNYKYTKKNTEELEEWKFTYSKVLNCRLWYTALLKLKAYFSKQEDKIEEFFNNFDPVKRNSHIPTLNKDPSSNSLKNYRASEMSIVSEFRRQDQNLDFIKKQIQAQSQPVSADQKKLPVSSPSPPPAAQKQETPFLIPNNSENNLQTINEDEELHNKKIEDDYREEIQEQVRMQEKKKNQRIIQNFKSELEAKNQKIKILEEAIKATDRLREKEEEAREKERIKEKQRQLQMERELERQRQKVKIRQKQELEAARQQQFRRKQKSFLQQADQNMTPLSLQSQQRNPRQTIELNQFSVQTDNQQEEDPSYQNDRQHRKKFTESYVSGLASTQRDTYNIFRNIGSFSFEMEEKDSNYQNYDYYTQIQAMSGNDIKFEDKIRRQIKLLNYVSKMKNIALDTIKQYIDTNNPTKSINFLGTLFETSIVCQHGKIININGEERLVYSNQEHQKLKREFKIYSYLQDKIIQMAEKRKKFGLRVPLCFFFEYRGYSALLKYMPYIKQIQEQEQYQKCTKLLLKIVDESNLQNYSLHTIANRPSQLYMVRVKNTYKITKELQNFLSSVNTSQKILGPSFLERSKMRYLSTNSHLIEKQIKRLHKAKEDKDGANKIMGLKQVLICRGLKKLYRSMEPFTQGINRADFFTGFLSSQQKIISLVSDVQDFALNGLFVTYFQHFFGLQIPADFDIYEFNLQQCQFIYTPLCRSFSFSSLYPTKLQKNLQTYISSQKNSLVQTAFSILNQVDPKSPFLQIQKIRYKLKQNQHSELDYPTMLQLLTSLNELKNGNNRHNTIQMEIFMLKIQCQTLAKMYADCLQTIYEAMGYVTYMLGPGNQEGYLEDYLCLLVAETLAKMGNYEDSITVYKKLLANKKSMLNQEEIYLSIAEIFYSFGQVDPYTLLQFLLSLLPPALPKHLQTEIQSRLHQQLGILYKRIGNIDLSIKHLQLSLTYYENQSTSRTSEHEQQINNLIQISILLFNSYTTMIDKSQIFNKVIMMVEINSKNQKFAVHIVRMVREFVTACFCQIVKGLNKNQRHKIRSVIEELRDGEILVPQTVNLVAYEDLIRSIEKIQARAQLGQKQARVLELLDLSYIQTFILTCQ